MPLILGNPPYSLNPHEELVRVLAGQSTCSDIGSETPYLQEGKGVAVILLGSIRVILGLDWDTGKENGNYYLRFGA